MFAVKLIPLVLVLAVAAQQAQARKVFRCDGSLVESGMTAAEVLAKCGEPDSRDSSSVPIRARTEHGGSYVVGTTTLEQWVYQRRPGQFPVHLTFDQGRLRSVEFLTRR